MTNNRMREFRNKLGLSQQALAEQCGVSLEQIQRIEADVQAPRFNVAVRICAALQQQMQALFPSTRPALQNAMRAGDLNPQTNLELKRELQDVGLDMSPVAWTFRFRLRGGYSQDLPVTGPEKDRLWWLVQTANQGFMIFDAGQRRYAINRLHLVMSHFLFDPQHLDLPEAPDNGRCELEVWLAEPGSPMIFSINPDTEEVRRDDESVDQTVSTQLQALFLDAEIERPEPLTFIDEDGETVFLRNADVALFSAPLEAVVPSLLLNEFDD